MGITTQSPRNDLSPPEQHTFNTRILTLRTPHSITANSPTRLIYMSCLAPCTLWSSISLNTKKCKTHIQIDCLTAHTKQPAAKKPPQTKSAFPAIIIAFDVQT